MTEPAEQTQQFSKAILVFMAEYVERNGTGSIVGPMAMAEAAACLLAAYPRHVEAVFMAHLDIALARARTCEEANPK